jgi:formylglycine-generating enzyme required for sulfatase activity/lysophospholipase L1-like esterase
MVRSLCRALFATLLLTTGAARAADAPDWLEPMKQVRARFTGTPGTFATFGDSITVSLAFWAPLRGEPRNMSPDLAAAQALVKQYMHPQCWQEWRGPKYGNNGSMTIRWAHDNVAKWLEAHNPEVAVILFGTNDLGALGLKEFEQKTAEVVERCLKNGTVVILTTLPPRSRLLDKAKEFAEAVRRVAKDKKVPLIDYQAEILKRRPDDWDGALPKFKEVKGSDYDVPTLIARDGVHPSNPKDHQDYAEESLNRNGYALRNYLTVLAYADVIRQALPADATAKAKRQAALTRLKAFEEEAAALAGAKPADGRVEPLRAAILRFLALPQGHELAEGFLALLLRLPPGGDKPPPAPKFPFGADAARRYQKDYAAWLGLPVEFRNGLGMSFVLVPPGTFTMGSPEAEPGHNAGGFDETLHPVTLTRPFYLGKHEATVGQFRRFVESSKYVTDGEKNGGGHAHDDNAVWLHRPGTSWRKPGYAGPFTLTDNHPVVHVSHTDAVGFCRWLQEQAGAKWTYGLPTEAQWEWACRAGSGTRYWWGKDEDDTGKVANVGDRSLKRVHPDWPRTIMAMNDGHAFPAPVGSYRANGFGLHDMLGNVWEFCGTRYGPYPKEAVTDPEGGDPKRGFAVRGGGWSNVAADVRCATRNADPPHFCHSNLGFRVALSIPVRP